MNTLERYIAKVTFLAILIIYIALILLFSFMEVLRASSWIGRGDFQTIDSFYYAIFSLPLNTYEIFPFCTLLGTLAGIYYLNSHNEIVAIKSSGFSNLNIIFSIIKLCIPLSLLLVFLGETVIPHSEKALLELKQKRNSNQIKVNLKNDVWIKDKQYIYHIKTIHSDKSLTNITIYQFDNHSQQLQHIIYSSKARVNQNEWLLKNVTETKINDQNIIKKHHQLLSWQTNISIAFIDIVSSHIKSLSAYDLYLYAQHLEQNKLDSSVYRLHFWQKIFAPISVFAMLLIAFPFATTHNRSKNTGAFLMIGVLIGISFTVLNKISAEFGLLYHLPAFISASLFTFLTIITAFYMIKKLN